MAHEAQCGGRVDHGVQLASDGCRSVNIGTWRGDILARYTHVRCPKRNVVVKFCTLVANKSGRALRFGEDIVYVVITAEAV